MYRCAGVQMYSNIVTLGNPMVVTDNLSCAGYKLSRKVSSHQSRYLDITLDTVEKYYLLVAVTYSIFTPI